MKNLSRGKRERGQVEFISVSNFMNAIILETDVQQDRILHLPDDLPIGAHVCIIIKPLSTVSQVVRSATV